ncbi:ribonuclease III [Bacteroides sp. OttesenSCG-928-D19]|nr:ribonuclease III [Bacteroides sp. OttesenSCG-928-D19]
MSLYNILGFYPNNIRLYEQAFIHRSVSASQYGKRSNNNERLEFLGDAVLDAIIADILYKHFPNKREGFLTNTRSKIVQRESLNNIALALGIDQKVTSMPYATTHHKYMYGNALEALIGAIYLDKGYRCCCKFVEERIINQHLSLDKLATQEVNFKSRLLEWGQKTKLHIKFELIETFTDKDGSPAFQTSVLLEGAPLGIGIGSTKKESQQLAAKTVIRKIQKDKEVQQLIEKLKNQQVDIVSDQQTEQ